MVGFGNWHTLSTKLSPYPFSSIKFLKDYTYLWGGYLCHGTYAEVRGQLESPPSCRHVGPRGQTQAVSYGGKCLYPLSLPTSLWCFCYSLISCNPGWLWTQHSPLTLAYQMLGGPRTALVLGPRIQVVMSFLPWVLGTKLRTLEEQQVPFTAESSLQSPAALPV